MVIQVCSDKKNREQVGGVDTLFTAAAKFGGSGGWLVGAGSVLVQSLRGADTVLK